MRRQIGYLAYFGKSIRAPTCAGADSRPGAGLRTTTCDLFLVSVAIAQCCLAYAASAGLSGLAISGICRIAVSRLRPRFPSKGRPCGGMVVRVERTAGHVCRQSGAGVPGGHDQRLCMLPASPYRDKPSGEVVTEHTRSAGATGVTGPWGGHGKRRTAFRAACPFCRSRGSAAGRTRTLRFPARPGSRRSRNKLGSEGT
jgi:hypothetical protein